MSDYLVITARSAQKDLDALPVEISSRIYPQINALAVVPRPPGCLKLKGEKNGWRIRVGDYRVIYTIDDDSQTIDISRQDCIHSQIIWKLSAFICVHLLFICGSCIHQRFMQSCLVKCVTDEKFTKGDIKSGYIKMIQCDRQIAVHNNLK